ncbi:MAG TPA: histidine phosphatase family protein, partial [Methylomirabilota bacterium]
MSLRLFLLRHGETDWNRERRHQGRTDTPLSEVGRTQAQAVARELKEHAIKAVYSS